MALPHENRIKLRHLSCFVEVAGHLSFGKAALALNLTQPAVSKAIAELEEILGTALFQRSRRGVSLTANGEAFQRYAGATLTSLRQGVETISQQNSGPLVAIGALPTVAARLMPLAVQHAKANGLKAVVRLHIGTTQFLMGHLHAGTVELVVGRLMEADAMRGLSFENLYSEPIIIAVRAGHPLLERAALSLRDIAGFTVIMPEAGSVIRPQIDQMLIASGIPALTDVIETVSPVFGRRYTLTSDAIWIISQGVIANDLDTGELVALPFIQSETPGPVGVTTKADVPLTVGAERIMQSLRLVVGAAQ